MGLIPIITPEVPALGSFHIKSSLRLEGIISSQRGGNEDKTFHQN